MIYEIQVIDALCKAVMQRKREEVIIELTELLETEKLNIDNMTLINAYGVLAITLQLEGRLEESREIIEKAYRMVENKIAFPRYHTMIITVLILTTSLLYHMEEYEDLIRYSKKLKNFQEKTMNIIVFIMLIFIYPLLIMNSVKEKKPLIILCVGVIQRFSLKIK